MSIDNIVFEDIDSAIVVATKTVLLFAGSSDLKPKLKKLGIEYTKSVRGLHTFYNLKGKDIGTIRIKL